MSMRFGLLGRCVLLLSYVGILCIELNLDLTSNRNPIYRYSKIIVADAELISFIIIKPLANTLNYSKLIRIILNNVAQW